jgi:hypothetical protein
MGGTAALKLVLSVILAQTHCKDVKLFEDRRIQTRTGEGWAAYGGKSAGGDFSQQVCHDRA